MIGKIRDVRHHKDALCEIYTGVVPFDKIEVNLTYNCSDGSVILHEGAALNREDNLALWNYAMGFFDCLRNLSIQSAS